MKTFVRGLYAVALAGCVPAAAPMVAPMASTQPQVGSDRIVYPQTRRVDHTDDYHGTRIADPYRWLEEMNAAETKQWIEAQNAGSSRYLAALPGRDAIQKRITELYNYPRVSTPYFEGGNWFYSRNTGLQRQNVIFTRKTLEGPERVALDPNSLSPDGSVSLSNFVPSPDGRHFAYGQSEGGSDWSTYYVRDLATGQQTADTVRWVKFSGISWTEDGNGFFYGRYPEPGAGEKLSGALRDKKIYYHRLGTPQSQDVLIYERPDQPEMFIGAFLDETGRYLFISHSRGSTSKNELLVADLGNPRQPNIKAPIRPLYTGHDASYGPLGVVNGRLYLVTDRDAPRRRVVAAPLANPSVANWRTIIPEGPNPLQGVGLIAGRIGTTNLEDVASTARLYTLEGKLDREIKLPGLGTTGGASGRFDRQEIFYSFTSPLYPSTVFRYDLKTGESTPWSSPKLTFDPTQYETKRVFYPSKDGTRVPMFVTHKKGMQLDGSNPVMLYAYGGFNAATLPTFRSDIPAWLELGGVWATANLRGGSEYGEAWHQAGMKEKKQNVFDDFIAAAEYLVKEKYTSPNKLAIMGGSNGGLLVGVVMQQRPDLFGVALPAVGVMDMLRYHKFTGGGAWAVEYGSADNPQDFQYLAKYSPLHNVKPGTCYPATLVTTADHDDRVVPSHSYKFTAATQAAQSCEKPVLIRIETQGSHGYRPLDKRIAELADQWAFTAHHLGMRVQ